MNAFIIRLYARPARAWRDRRDEEEHSPRHYLPHLILLGLIPAVCLYIGTTQVGWRTTLEDRVWLSTESALQLCTLLYIAILAGTTLMGAFIRWLSRTSEARPTLNQCIGFATYTITPFFIAGLAALYPSGWLMMLILGLAAIHSTFLLIIGTGAFIRLPPGNAPLYAAAVWGVGVLVLVTILVSTLLLWHHVLTPDYVHHLVGKVPGG